MNVAQGGFMETLQSLFAKSTFVLIEKKYTSHILSVGSVPLIRSSMRCSLQFPG